MCFLIGTVSQASWRFIVLKLEYTHIQLPLAKVSIVVGDMQ